MRNKFNITVTILLLSVIALTSCNQFKLEDQEAKNLVIATLNLPQKYTEDVTYVLGSAKEFYILEDAGFIYQEEGSGLISGVQIHCTDKGKPYLIRDKGGVTLLGLNSNTLEFQAFDIDIDQITGIAINKEEQTATVRFTLKATNISPICRALKKDIDNLRRSSELIYKKFDKGWQLESEFDQNTSGSDLVREIWWGQNAPPPPPAN